MRNNLPARIYTRFISYLFLILLCFISYKGLARVSGATIFRDDFNRNILGSAWQTNYWSIVNGSAYNGYGGPLSTTNSYSQTSYVIETAAKGFTNNYYREFMITFGQANL